MNTPTKKPILSARRPPGIHAGSRLGRIIARMNGIAVCYRLWIGAGGDREMSGSGRLRVESVDGWTRCRVMGDLYRVSPVEFGFHCFWLTRRGMILLVADWLQDRPPATRTPGETFLQPVNLRDRTLKAEATRWLE